MTGAAAHASGDENHIRVADGFTDSVKAFFRRARADFRLGTRTEATGQLFAELDFMSHTRTGKRLHISIGINERYIFLFGASQSRVNHMLKGLFSSTTKT